MMTSSKSADSSLWVTTLAAVVLGAIVVLALAGPFFAPLDPTQTVGRPFSPDAGVFGTELLGRDVLSRLLHGGRPLVIAPVLITIAATLVGLAVGLTLAQRTMVSSVLRVMDVFAIIPPLVVILVLLLRFGTSMVVVGAASIISSTPFVARYIRSVAEPILNSGYVEHAELVGEPRGVIMWRHVIPNLVGPVLADTVLRLPGTLYLVAAASFLGFGTTANPDWAAMLQENLPGVQLNVWAVAAPALIIAMISVPLNVLGDQCTGRWNIR